MNFLAEINLDEVKNWFSECWGCKHCKKCKKEEEIDEEPDNDIVPFQEHREFTIYDVALVDNSDFKWGMATHFDDNYEDWRVDKIDFKNQSQAEHLGIRLDDIIMKIDGNEINEDNCEAMKLKLREGKSCTLTFKREVKDATADYISEETLIATILYNVPIVIIQIISSYAELIKAQDCVVFFENQIDTTDGNQINMQLVRDHNAPMINLVLKTNATWKYLNIRCNLFEEDHCYKAIANGLLHNSILRSLSLTDHKMGPNLVRQFGDALKMNTTLKLINLNKEIDIRNFRTAPSKNRRKKKKKKIIDKPNVSWGQ